MTVCGTSFANIINKTKDMLAIIILVAVFYVALNYSGNFKKKESNSSFSNSQLKSFKESERKVSEHVDMSVSS